MATIIPRKDQVIYGVIYCIINTANNNRYIGSAYDIAKRFSTHLRQLKTNKHHNIHLQRAFNKYGENCFVIEILTHEPRETLLFRENYFLALLKPEYNIARDASAPMKGRKHTDATLLKFKTRKTGKGTKKVPWSEEARRKHLAARIGLKRSEEFKERRRQESLSDNRSRYLDKHREESRKPIKDSLGNTFVSMVECSKFHGISVQTVCDILKGRHNKTRKGVSFEYL